MEPALHFLVSTWQGNLISITLLHLLTWGYTVVSKMGFCSDDIDGVAKFSDRFIQEKDSQGNVIKEYEVRDYEIENQGKKVRIKNTGWNGYIEFPGCLLRWLRLNWGRNFQKIGENTKGHTIYGWVQSSRKHHALNLIFQWFNLLLGYNFLSQIVGQEVAFLSMLVFAVHPCGVQTVGWISGVNYLFSLCGTLLTLNAVLYIQNLYILIPVVAITTGFSCLTLLPGCFTWIILFFLGYWNAGIVALLIGLVVLSKQGKEVVAYRFKAFKEQKMERTTKIEWRKPIVMIKTFWYYCKFIPFPKRLGLFHTWGYHFQEPIKYVNKEFWLGLMSIALYITAFIFSPFIIKFALLWMAVYLIVFSNFVTAQQFVSERYCFTSTFGFSIIVACLLQSYPILLSFLIGVAVMRVWVHLPTFKNEVRFYESNWFNFPDSEVAMGNLGVAYINHGLPNKGLDTWLEGTRQNKLYDVPWYNLYSLCKQNGDFVGARRFLKMCLDSNTIHFPDQWQREYQELERIIEHTGDIGTCTRKINQAIKEANYEHAGAL